MFVCRKRYVCKTKINKKQHKINFKNSKIKFISKNEDHWKIWRKYAKIWKNTRLN